ncbi:hypothetical protein T484DRAFT_3630870, partial [Baffinella frigidus]
SGFEVLGLVFWCFGVGFRVSGSGFRVPGSGFGVSGSGFRVSVSSFRFSVSGFCVPSSGFRVFGFRFSLVLGSGSHRSPSFDIRMHSNSALYAARNPYTLHDTLHQAPSTVNRQPSTQSPKP